MASSRHGPSVNDGTYVSLRGGGALEQKAARIDNEQEMAAETPHPRTASPPYAVLTGHLLQERDIEVWSSMSKNELIAAWRAP